MFFFEEESNKTKAFIKLSTLDLTSTKGISERQHGVITTMQSLI